MSISRYIGGDDFEASLMATPDVKVTNKDLYTAYRKAKDNKILVIALIFAYIIGIVGIVIAFLALSGSGVLYNVLTGKVKIADASTSYLNAAFGK